MGWGGDSGRVVRRGGESNLIIFWNLVIFGGDEMTMDGTRDRKR